ncbi:MAG: potassium channel family protein [Pseudomonadales bacterium]|jgi:hypothetical protein
MLSFVFASAVAGFTLILCLIMHYEAMNLLERMSREMRRHRWIVLLTMGGLMLAHMLEIWLFAGAFYAAEHLLGLGTVSTPTGDWLDYVYYSAVVYTTVGFGDMVPSAGLRMLTMAEALTGLSLITWSASLTFLQMQRLWRT